MADRSAEIRSRQRAASPTVEVRLPAEAAGKLLCLATHRFALMLGTIPPLVRCGSGCRMYPPGHPTTWTWPG
jgi:hypothetical protein